LGLEDFKFAGNGVLLDLSLGGLHGAVVVVSDDWNAWGEEV